MHMHTGLQPKRLSSRKSRCGGHCAPASPALPEPTFRLNNCDLAVRAAQFQMLLSLHVVLIGLAGAGALSVRAKLPHGTAAFWQSSHAATLRERRGEEGEGEEGRQGGDGGEKNCERLSEVFTARSGRRAAALSAGILTWFSAGFLQGFRLFRVPVEKNKMFRTQGCAGVWGLKRGVSRARTAQWGVGKPGCDPQPGAASMEGSHSHGDIIYPCWPFHGICMGIFSVHAGHSHRDIPHPH